MPTIYIPNPNKPVRCINQIDDVCRDIEKTINQTIQNTLNQLEKDCVNIAAQVDQAIADDNDARSNNMWAWSKALGYLLMGIFAPIMIIIYLAASTVSDKIIKDLLGKDGHQMLQIYLTPLKIIWGIIPEDYYVYSIISLILISVLLIMKAKVVSRRLPTMSRKRKKLLQDQQEFVATVVKNKKKTLYKEYLEQTVSEHDL